MCVCVCVCLGTGHFCNMITGTVWCYTMWLISAINATVRIINVVILLLDKKDLLTIIHCLVCYITFSVKNGMVVHRRYLFRHYENLPPTHGSPDQSRPPPCNVRRPACTVFCAVFVECLRRRPRHLHRPRCSRCLPRNNKLKQY